jgi:hypothetical protein
VPLLPRSLFEFGFCFWFLLLFVLREQRLVLFDIFEALL